MKIDSLTVVNSIMIFGIALAFVAWKNTVKGNHKLEKENEARVRKQAIDTFGTEEAALEWMRKPHPMLDGESPLESAATSFGSRRVRNILVSIKYGGVV